MLTGGPTAQEAAIVGAHFAYLKRLMEQGVVILDGDPAVQGGVMGAKLFPYRIALLKASNAEPG